MVGKGAEGECWVYVGDKRKVCSKGSAVGEGEGEVGRRQACLFFMLQTFSETSP